MKNPLFVTLAVATSVYLLVFMFFGETGTHYLSYTAAIIMVALEVFTALQAWLVRYLAKNHYNEMPADTREMVMSRLYSLHIRAFDHHIGATQKQLRYFGWPIVVGGLCSLAGFHILGTVFVMAFFAKAVVMNMLWVDVQEYIAEKDLEKKGSNFPSLMIKEDA